jgi:homoserine dehydrogenase
MHMVVSPTTVTRADDSPVAPRAIRTIRIGLLGLGQVGQAVVRATACAGDVLRARGLDLCVTGALVRDLSRSRRCPRVPRVSTNPETFLRGQYDLVIEALGGVEPARSLVARLLGRGIPVVSANKSLVAAHGRRLQALARRRQTILAYEASVLAGVPFLGTLLRRPLAAHATAITAIVNGTSHFILSTMERGASFGAALTDAQARGYAEPDPSKDVLGIDAAEKLALLLDVLDAPHAEPESINVEGIGDVREVDLALARRLGGCLKPVVRAAWSGDELDAFVGPAFVPGGHPLSNLSGRLNGVCLDGPFVGDLFYSGPGAGPDVTAATLLDDAVETMSSRPGPAPFVPRRRPATVVTTDESAWFVRGRPLGDETQPANLSALLAARGVPVREIVTATTAGPTTIGLLTHPCERDRLVATLEQQVTDVRVYRAPSPEP